MIRRLEEQQESLRERAQVAAELVEEARQLTEASMQGTEAPSHPATPGTDGNGNGNGNSHGPPRPLPADDLTGAAAIRTTAERTLAALDQAVARTPDDVDLLLHRATQLGAMGRYAAARDDLERALLLAPDNVAVQNALGIVLLRKGLWAQAVPHLRRVVEVESWSPTAWFYLGEALNHIDDLDGALAAFGRAAELDPHHAKALYGQGIVLDRLRRPTDATRLYRRSREVAAR
jgi:Flp pilus assembly protein TadD